jgi:hypothetical protein
MFQSNAKYYVKSTITSTQAAGTTFLLSTDFEQAANLETGTDSVSFVLKNGTQIERMEITATGGTATIVKRGLTQAQTSAASVGNQKQWTDGSIGYVTALAYDLVNERNAKPLKLTIPTVADNTARSALYPSPTGGEKVMNTANGGKEEVYNSVAAQWQAAGTSTAVGNATTAAAGIVELATTAESKAGTATGGTGASLSVLPSDIAANAQSATFIYAASADVTDTYTASLTPALTAYTTGMMVRIKFTTANTGACTLNLNGLGAKDIKARNGSDTSTGAIIANDISELVYDGTNFVLQSVTAASLSDLKSAIPDKFVPASLAGSIVGTPNTTTDTVLSAGGTTLTYSSSVSFPNGGIVSFDVVGTSSTGINTNRHGVEYSTDNTNWFTLITFDYGGNNGSYYRSASFLIKAGNYVRAFAGGIGSNTAGVTVTLRAMAV